MVTLLDRTTRFTLLVPIPTDCKPHAVRDAIASTIVELPEQLRRTLMLEQARRLPDTRASQPRTRSTCASATHTPPGNAASTRTRTGRSGTTCHSATTSLRPPQTDPIPSVPAARFALDSTTFNPCWRPARPERTGHDPTGPSWACSRLPGSARRGSHDATPFDNHPRQIPPRDRTLTEGRLGKAPQGTLGKPL